MDHYFGRNEFPGNKEGLLCKWGIHDGPVLDWMAEVQEKLTEPFLTAWFSISNHFPFDAPQNCPPHILNRKLKPSETTAMYTDYVIGQYFKKVSRMPWFSRTIFVITADHCLYGPEDKNRPFMKSFHVPLILLGPGVPVGRDSALGSQLSILPTLIELLRLDTYHASASVSLFSKSRQPIMLSNMVGVLCLAKNNISYCTTLENAMPCYRWDGKIWAPDDSVQKSEEGDRYLKLLKAVYQVCYNARIKNKTFGTEWMK